jgi:outer membrane protein assembly factor BamE
MPLLSSPRRALLTLPAALCALLLSACSSLSADIVQRMASVITPYRVEVVQGNVVTKEQLAVLKPGLTREQVRQLLGAPLLADPFHAQRWDYVFLIRRQGTETQQRGIVVMFEGDVVKTVEAPELPTEREFVASISRAPVADSTRKLELSPEERAALPVPVRPEVTAANNAPQGAVRSYPPLEAP